MRPGRAEGGPSTYWPSLAATLSWGQTRRTLIPSLVLDASAHRLSQQVFFIPGALLHGSTLGVCDSQGRFCFVFQFFNKMEEYSKGSHPGPWYP